MEVGIAKFLRATAVAITAVVAVIYIRDTVDVHSGEVHVIHVHIHAHDVINGKG